MQIDLTEGQAETVSRRRMLQMGAVAAWAAPVAVVMRPGAAMVVSPPIDDRTPPPPPPQGTETERTPPPPPPEPTDGERTPTEQPTEQPTDVTDIGGTETEKPSPSPTETTVVKDTPPIEQPTEERRVAQAPSRPGGGDGGGAGGGGVTRVLAQTGLDAGTLAAIGTGVLAAGGGLVAKARHEAERDRRRQSWGASDEPRSVLDDPEADED